MRAKKVKKEILKKVYQKRPKGAHKGDYGYVLIVGGDKYYSGAPTFAGLAALKAGCDLVTICAPQRAADICATFSPSLITCPLEGENLAPKHSDIILETAQKFDVLLIGCGVGDSNETQQLIKTLIKKSELPLVLDAQAIKPAKNLKKDLKSKDLLLTPHIKEFEALTGNNISKQNLKEKSEAVKKAASKFDATILLKGPIDIISEGKEVLHNGTGTPYMTVGGTGDVLAGICAGIKAQGVDILTSAKAGAYISGKAGKRAARKKGPALMADDVIRYIASVVPQNFSKKTGEIGF